MNANNANMLKPSLWPHRFVFCGGADFLSLAAGELVASLLSLYDTTYIIFQFVKETLLLTDSQCWVCHSGVLGGELVNIVVKVHFKHNSLRNQGSIQQYFYTFKKVNSERIQLFSERLYTKETVTDSCIEVSNENKGFCFAL